MASLFDWGRFFEDIPKLLPYLSVTLDIVLYGTLFGSLLGILIALVKIHRIPILQQIFAVFVSFVRGTPMLVQLMIVMYGLPILIDPIFGTNLNRTLDKIYFVYIAFILNQGVFLSAVFYSGFTSVPAGQTDAARSVGLTEFQTFRRILFPQAVRAMLPSFGSTTLSMLHNTSLAYLAGVIDLVGRAKTIGAATKHVLEAYIFVAILFAALSILIRLLFAWLGKRFDYQQRGERRRAYEH